MNIATQAAWPLLSTAAVLLTGVAAAQQPSSPAPSSAPHAATETAQPVLTQPVQAEPTQPQPVATQPAPAEPTQAQPIPPTPAASSGEKPRTPSLTSAISVAAPAPPALAEATASPAAPAATPALTAPAAEAPTGPASSSPATRRPPPATPQDTSPVGPTAPLSSFMSAGIVVANHWNTAPAYDFFSTNDVLTQIGMQLGADLLALSPQATLAAEVSALTGTTGDDGPLPTYIRHSKLQQTDLGAAVSLRYAVLDWLSPHARLGGGASFASTTIESNDFEELSDDSTAGYLDIGAGLTFFSPSKRLSSSNRYFNSIGISVVAEGGYQATSALAFSRPAQPQSDDPEDRQNIAVAATPLGELPRGGFYLRLAALARF